MYRRSNGASRPNTFISRAFAAAFYAGTAATAIIAGTQAATAQQRVVTVNVPAGPLSTALNQLAVQTGIHIGFDSAIVRNMTTQGLSGKFTTDEALQKLLAGTGVRYSFSDTRTVTLIREGGDTEAASEPAEGDVTVLKAITINGGSGGVITADGYVGKSSATGAKTDTPFIETPQSISSVTPKQIEDRNPQSLPDAIAYTPGVRVNAYSLDPRYDSFFVRGFNVTNTGVFRDNLRQPTGGYAIFTTEPYGIEGVSILRGPSSALYGATGAGGLYNVITKRPTEDPLREVQLQFGNNNRYQTQFDFSGPVSEDNQLFYRLTGLGRLSDTELMAVPDDRVYIAPAITWKPDEDTKLTVLGEYTRSKTGGNPAYYNDSYGHVSKYMSGDPAYTDLIHKQARIGYEFEHSFNDMFTVRQNLRYQTQDVDAKYVYIWRQNPLDPTLLDRGAGHDVQKLNSFVVDNQLETRLSTGPIEHTILTGLDYTWVKYNAFAGVGDIDPLNTVDLNYGDYIAGPALTSGTNQRQLQTGLYVQDQLRYDAWTLTLGGRYDWVTTNTDSTDIPSSTVSTLDQKDKEFSGRIGLNYKTPFDVVLYGTYSTAFSPNVGWNSTTDAPFNPTTSTQQEIGVKYLLPNANVMLTAALFNIDQDNGIFYDASHSGTIPVQRGRLRSKGVELEATASLDSGLSFTAAYTYTDLKILEGPPNTVGKYVSSVPFHSASAWVDYTMPENTVLEGFSGGLGARFIGRSYGDDRNILTNGSRVLFDAALRYDFAAIDPKYDGVKLQVNATNIFNRTDTTCTSGYCYKDQGSSVIGTLRYNW
jgi:iron complex outermembrane receptor protein